MRDLPTINAICALLKDPISASIMADIPDDKIRRRELKSFCLRNHAAFDEDSIGILQAIADGRATNPDWDALLAVLPSIPMPATLEVTEDDAG